MPKPSEAAARPDAAPPAIAAGTALALMPWMIGGRIATAWLEGATRLNGEWARFVADRLAQDAQTQHEILACRTPAEGQRIGAAFLQRAVHDYIAESARLSSLAADASPIAGGGRPKDPS